MTFVSSKDRSVFCGSAKACLLRFGKQRGAVSLYRDSDIGKQSNTCNSFFYVFLDSIGRSTPISAFAVIKKEVEHSVWLTPFTFAFLPVVWGAMWHSGCTAVSSHVRDRGFEPRFVQILLECMMSHLCTDHAVGLYLLVV